MSLPIFLFKTMYPGAVKSGFQLTRMATMLNVAYRNARNDACRGHREQFR